MLPAREYCNRLFLFRDTRIRRDIAALDPRLDCQRIVFLLTCYEFPFDMTRSLELALFHTYASPSVAAILDRTGEFHCHGQKRYDDTAILVKIFMQEGYETGLGARALSRMNLIHSHYPISGEDFAFVLGTFIFYPIWWMQRFAYRPLTDHEQQGLYYFWAEVGRRMSIPKVPGSLEDFRNYMEAYEAKHFRYSEASRNVAEDTINILRNWLPPFLRFAVKPAVCALVPKVLLRPLGLALPSLWVCRLMDGVVWVRKQIAKVLQLEEVPSFVSNTTYRSYPGPVKPPPEALGPDSLSKGITQ